MTGAPRIDVQTTTPYVTRINRELQRFAAGPNVHENALHALLMKLVVISKAHNVLKQSCLIDLIARVGNLNTPPIGLTCHQTIAFEQVAHQCFRNRRLIVLRLEQIWRWLIVSALNVHAV